MDDPALSTDPLAPDPLALGTIICPNCGAPIAPELDPEKQLVHCPYCLTDFVPQIVDDPDETAVEWQEPTDPDSELDGMRIRKVTQLRRSAIRARTYALVVLICCLVMSAQLILTDLQEVSSYGWDRWAILYAFSAGALLVVAMLASRKAAALHRESMISGEIHSEHTPEFDALSDGSQRVKHLEEMMNDE